ncbi:MAG: peptidylprolyl isomerase [Oscillospiraceae bacterium]|nr:peptidylprolyl isomerase [Oscillospiraceae bacterium]
MGASQEKKRRRAAMEETLSAKPAKQKKGMAKWLKITIIAVIVALLVAAAVYFTSGYFYRNTTAVRMGDSDYSIAEFNYYYTRAYDNYYNYVMENYEDSYMNYLPNDKIPYDQQLFSEGVTWDDYFEGNAMNLLEELTFLYNRAVEDGYELSREGKSTINEELYNVSYTAASNGYANVDQYLAVKYGKGMTYDYYKEMLQKYQLSQEYAENKAETFKFSQEDLATYYDMMKDTYDVIEYRSYDFPIQTGEGVDENAAKDEAYYTATEFNEAVKSEADFIRLAREYASEENAEKFADDDATLTSAMASNIDMESSVEAWLLEETRVPGDKEIIETNDGYQVVYFVNRNDNSYNLISARQILVQPESILKSDYDDDAAYQAALDSAKADAKAKAEKYLKEWLDKGGTEDQFIEMADQYSDDSTPGGLYEEIYNGKMIKEFNDWLFNTTHKPGDYTLVETQYGYHIIYFVSYGERYCDFIAQTDLGAQAYEEWYEDAKEDYDPVKTFAFRFAK